MYLVGGNFIKKLRGNGSLIYLLILTALLAVGAYFRLYNLGSYSLFASDDGVTTMSIRSIMNYGYSAMPSGLLYPKELLFSYPAAWLCKIFGFNEFMLRIFNLPFGLGVILLTYFLAKELFDRNVGLLSAGIITFATWSLEFNRFVRSYTLVQFLFVLSVYLFFKAFVKKERVNKIVLLLLFILCVFSSFLGAILIVLLFSLWLIKGKRIFERSTITFAALFVGITLLWFHFYESLVVDLRVRNVSEKVSALGVIEKIPWPRFEIFTQLFSYGEAARYIFVAIYAIICLYSIRGLMIASQLKRRKSDYVLIFGLATLIFFDLPEMGILLFLGYLIVSRKNIKDLLRFPSINGVIILIAGILWWLACGLFLHKATSLFAVARDINLFKFPPLFYYLYLAVPFPKMAIIVFLGLVMLYLGILRNKNRDRALFILSLFLGIIMFLAIAWQHSHPRYNFPAYPLFLIIYSFAILELARRLAGLLKIKPRHGKAAKLLLVALFLWATLEHANILEAYHTVNVAYGEQVIHPYLITSHRTTHYFDYKGTGDYVRTHMNKDDLVITAFERLLLYSYIGQVDYNVYMPEEKVVNPDGLFNEKNSFYSDPYIANGAICSVDILKEVISKNLKRGKSIWIVTPNYQRLVGKQREFVNECRQLYKGFYELLNSYRKYLVYVSKDNIIEAYRITP